jgi:hypothetical protein
LFLVQTVRETSSSSSAASGAASGKGATKAPQSPPSPGVAWKLDGGDLSLAASDAPVARLRFAMKPEQTLADEPLVAKALASLGTSACGVVVLQPLRFDATRANLPAASLVGSLGRSGADASIRVVVAHGLLRELGRRELGL